MEQQTWFFTGSHRLGRGAGQHMEVSVRSRNQRRRGLSHTVFFRYHNSRYPILILEYTMGKTYRGGAPVTWARMNRKFEWLGWMQAMIAFVIGVYYFAIIVWVVSYIGFSFTQAWGDDPSAFLAEYLGLRTARWSSEGYSSISPAFHTHMGHNGLHNV